LTTGIENENTLPAVASLMSAVQSAAVAPARSVSFNFVLMAGMVLFAMFG
jgi:hypothetical protein